jgi:hypothetical protein
VQALTLRQLADLVDISNPYLSGGRVSSERAVDPTESRPV